MEDFFESYTKIKDLLRGVKDPIVIKHLNESLDFMRIYMFKSDEYLDSILEKNINDVVPQDLYDILSKIGDPDNHTTWCSIVKFKHGYVTTYLNGVYRFTEQLININKNSINTIMEMAKPGQVCDSDILGSFDYVEIGFMKEERLIIVKTILNMYRLFKLNKELNNNVRRFTLTHHYNPDNYWESLVLWLFEYHIDVLSDINIDYTNITRETENLVKSTIVSNKFCLSE